MRWEYSQCLLRSCSPSPRSCVDLNVINLIPAYRQLLKRVKPTKVKVRQWTQDATMQLQGSLACTDWGVFAPDSVKLNEHASIITDYIELCPVFQPLFKQSVDIGVIPIIWKTSIVVPVPKMSSPSELNHFRPVALTSIVMKCFERLILSHILPHVQSQLDPYQFAYRSRRGTGDAIACLLHKLFEHMETAGNYARILFIDFSSAFNTIQRHVMIDKLQKLEVPAALVHWVFNFLSNRPQCVRVVF